MATLAGVPRHAGNGFAEVERVTDRRPDRARIEFVRMVAAAGG